MCTLCQEICVSIYTYTSVLCVHYGTIMYVYICAFTPCDSFPDNETHICACVQVACCCVECATVLYTWSEHG